MQNIIFLIKDTDKPGCVFEDAYEARDDFY